MHWVVTATLFLVGLVLGVVVVVHVHLRRNYRTSRGGAMGVLKLVRLIYEGKYRTVHSAAEAVLPTKAEDVPVPFAVVAADPRLTQRHHATEDGYATEVADPVFPFPAATDPTGHVSVMPAAPIIAPPAAAYESVYAPY